MKSFLTISLEIDMREQYFKVYIFIYGLKVFCLLITRFCFKSSYSLSFFIN